MRTLPRHKAIEKLNNAASKRKTTAERANSNIAAGTVWPKKDACNFKLTYSIA